MQGGLSSGGPTSGHLKKGPFYLLFNNVCKLQWEGALNEASNRKGKRRSHFETPVSKALYE